MLPVRNIFLTFVATMICVVQVCACHIAQAAMPMDHSAHMSGQMAMDEHSEHRQALHQSDPTPSEDACSHCDAVTEVNYIPAQLADIQKPAETELLAAIPVSLRLNDKPTYVVRSFVRKRWRPPLRQTPVSLKIRLLN